MTVSALHRRARGTGGAANGSDVITGMTTAAAPPVSTAASASHHPSVIAEAERRSADIQLRVADAITKFAGSMNLVYAHVLAFAVWMLVVEKSPWPTLTLVVSLEAIFLSTFVMIGQNRQAAFQRTRPTTTSRRTSWNSRPTPS